MLTEKSSMNQSIEKQHNVMDQSEKKARPVIYTGDSFLDTLLKPTLIVAIGDSLTQGVGDSKHQGGYVPYLKKRLERESYLNSVKIVNHGLIGIESVQLLKQLNNKNVQKDIKSADFIIVTNGGNDIMNVFRQHFTNLKMDQFQLARRKYIATLKQFMDKIRLYNKMAPIYFVGLYNPFSKQMAELYELDWIVSDWNKSGKMMVEMYEPALYIEIEDIFNNTSEDLFYTEDYFHPNDRGYELIAARIYHYIEYYLNAKMNSEPGIKGDE